MPKFKSSVAPMLMATLLFVHGATRATAGADSMQPALSPQEIMQKVEDFDDGDNMIADIELVLTDRNGTRQVRKMRRFAKNFGPGQRDEHTYSYFHFPPVLDGTRVLTYDYHDHGMEDDTWIFIPEVGKTKRLTSKDRTSRLMGSDISYGDLTQRDIGNYSFKMLGEEKVRGWDTWMVEFVPKTEEETRRFGYLKGHVWVDKESFRVVRSIFWKSEGNQVKYFEIHRMERIDGIWTALDMSFTVKKGDVFIHRTDMLVNNPRYNQGLPASMFLPDELHAPLPDNLLPAAAAAGGTMPGSGLPGATAADNAAADGGTGGMPKNLIGLLAGLAILAGLGLAVLMRLRQAGAAS